ncbi:hypothetical protein M758_UG279300 [Ceratodon purpureus]|nr:hypothetical protein M758_N000400 [Ceratodon purpureus]KAG0596721.1 hypothetical protein M758_UG279300 [Ceratodon purpureus]
MKFSCKLLCQNVASLLFEIAAMLLINVKFSIVLTSCMESCLFTTEKLPHMILTTPNREHLGMADLGYEDNYHPQLKEP